MSIEDIQTTPGIERRAIIALAEAGEQLAEYGIGAALFRRIADTARREVPTIPFDAIRHGIGYVLNEAERDAQERIRAADIETADAQSLAHGRMRILSAIAAEAAPLAAGALPADADATQIEEFVIATLRRARGVVTTDLAEAVSADRMQRTPEHAERWQGGACSDITAERIRQINQEGWTAEHDDEYGDAVLGRAAIAYIAAGIRRDVRLAERYTPATEPIRYIDPWPWDSKWDKRPGPDADIEQRRQALVKAGALIAAEIDRLDRAQAKLKLAKQAGTVGEA